MLPLGAMSGSVGQAAAWTVLLSVACVAPEAVSMTVARPVAED